jgi:CDGSH-type Zn-finger protein/uncharacterized Fe-S cluster protein YjdI
MTTSAETSAPSREALLHMLYEAAELEHDLMCTYLYAAYSLKSGQEDGLTAEEAAIVNGWRQRIMSVAIDEMGHLAAVWNITAALGGAPRFGRGNFPLDPGTLPARVVVKLSPFNRDVLQHFIHLERPGDSPEDDGDSFAPPSIFQREIGHKVRVTPMPVDYDTVGAFYATLSSSLRAFVALHGEDVAFSGDPALQLSPAEVDLTGAKPVICLKTALAAFQAIVEQGEGAAADASGSHYQRFLSIRREFDELIAKNPHFSPAFPAAHNPVLRPPMGRSGRVWLENEDTAQAVDVANSGYALMLRLIAYSYVVPRPAPEKALAVDLALALMRAVTPLGELAARLPAGPSNPDCHGGMSFTTLRDAAPLLPGPSAVGFFIERLTELRDAAQRLTPSADGRTEKAVRWLDELLERALRGFEAAAKVGRAAATPPPKLQLPVISPTAPPVPRSRNGIDEIDSSDMTLIYEGKRCIHARFCVTGAPTVFLANVVGPWIHPEAIPVDRLVEIAHACPSGAIRYTRKDGKADESAPPVNLISIRESGPYAVRAELNLAGKTGEYRATLCRCGASKNKPYCDGSHHDVAFEASGEPKTTVADMLPERAGELTVEPLLDGPLSVRGNLEITSGTGRVVARLTQAKLCRCGGSSNKPFCDGTHARIGFKSA